jgi:hypothetical protein
VQVQVVGFLKIGAVLVDGTHANAALPLTPNGRGGCSGFVPTPPR